MPGKPFSTLPHKQSLLHSSPHPLSLLQLLVIRINAVQVSKHQEFFMFCWHKKPRFGPDYFGVRFLADENGAGVKNGKYHVDFHY